MPLKEAKGNMYDWVTHTHSHLGGECPHKCSYCYVQRNRFGVSPRYQGEPRLIEQELKVNYGTGKTIFIEHMNDLFAHGINTEFIGRILTHCNLFNENKYVFQTKDPRAAFGWYRKQSAFPKNFIIGTTIETNSIVPGCAPLTADRAGGIKLFRESGIRTFVTIEPIMDFDVNILSTWIIDARPDFVNIGADSKGCGLPEPSKEKILELVRIITAAGVVIKKKTNLARLLGRIS